MHHRFTRSLAATAGALGLALSFMALPGAASPARAADVDDTAASAALMAAQEPIVDAANETNTLAKGDAGSDFAGITVSVEDHGYTLYWKGGTPPAPIADAIKAHQARGIQVNVVPARYSAKELMDRGLAITASGARIGGAQITSVRPGNDGNSLSIGVNEQQLPPRSNGSAALSAAALPADLTGGIPITVTAEAPSDTTAAQIMARDNTKGPLVGGMFLKMGTQLCTSGFGVKSYGSQSTAGVDQYFLLTAEHCGPAGTKVYSNDGNQIGTVVDTNPTYDISRILVNRASPDIWTGGPVLSSSQSMNAVHGTADMLAGETVCVSGSLMGEVCGGRVTSVRNIVLLGDHYRVVAQVTQLSGRLMAGKGDSGGPVYMNGARGIIATGILSGTHLGEKCKNPYGGTRLACSPTVWVADVSGELTLDKGSVVTW
ncbi:hypothetical protein AB0O91_31240 [Kitasatospora sp. NPDC089797]|uniref:trypsin-like serine protease n=1 Tax=Kitasatospora sp. NPDC089797 TaxID=3155298 RepID=UPI00343BD007